MHLLPLPQEDSEAQVQMTYVQVTEPGKMSPLYIKRGLSLAFDSTEEKSMFPSENKEQRQSHVQMMKESLQTVWEDDSRKREICSQALFAAGVHNALCLLQMLLQLKAGSDK